MVDFETRNCTPARIPDDRTYIRHAQTARDHAQSPTGSRTVAHTHIGQCTPSSAESRRLARATSRATRGAMKRAIRRSARSPRRASRWYAARRRRCSNRRERSPAPQADGGSRTRQRTWSGMGSVQPAEDKAKDSAPDPRIDLPTCPRRPLLCPRTSSPATV